MNEKNSQTKKGDGLDYAELKTIEIPEKGERICPICKGIIQLDRDRNDLIVKDNFKRNRYYHKECAITKRKQKSLESYPGSKSEAERRITREDIIELLEFSNMYKMPVGGE